MAGMRVHQLADELGISRAEVFNVCRRLGIGVTSYSSSLGPADADRLRAEFERSGEEERCPGEEEQRSGEEGQRPVVASETIRPWRKRGFTRKEAVAWIDAGVDDPAVAERLCKSQVGAASIEILRAGARPEELEAWLTTRRYREDELIVAAQLLAERGDAWRASGLPVTEWPRWMKFFPTTPSVAQVMRDKGATIAAVERAVSNNHVKKSELLYMVATGHTLQQQIARSNRGATDPPVEDRFSRWLSDGKEWLTSSRTHVTRHRAFLRSLYESGLTWANPDGHLLVDDVDEEWFDEVLARAETLLARLRA